MCLAVPGKIIAIEGSGNETMRMGKVDFGGIKKAVNLHLVPEANEGDFVLVHVGVAISTVDEEEAQRTLNFLEGMGEMDELKINEDLERYRKS